MTGSDALDAVVDRFIATVSGHLAEAAQGISGFDPAHTTADVTQEAYNLCRAMVDSDGRHSDDELWPLIACFAPRLDDATLSRATPDDLRATELLQGMASWLDRPSDLFEILLAADRRAAASSAGATDATNRAKDYYLRSMDVVHTMAAMDVIPTSEELAAIDRFRRMLLGRINAAALPPSTTPGPQANSDETAVAAATPGPTDAPSSPPLPPPRSLDDLFAELDDLVGLDAVKTEVRRVADLLRVQQLRHQHGLPTVDRNNHLIFAGNPGTGKTTVARLVAQIYRTLGVVKNGQLIETDRSGLVAGFVGQTAPLVASQFDKADEGILFIDEAYSLIRGGASDFGKEAIDAIVKNVEDRRDRVVVIMAGYTEEMGDLLNTNPGLRSRFPKTIFFDDYTTGELIEICQGIADHGGYRLSDEAIAKLRLVIDAVPRDRNFGNGRLIRNIFEEAMARQASRIVAVADPTTEQLEAIDAVDIPDTAPGHVEAVPA